MKSGSTSVQLTLANDQVVEEVEEEEDEIEEEEDEIEEEADEERKSLSSTVLTYNRRVMPKPLTPSLQSWLCAHSVG